MSEKLYYTAKEVAEMLGISEGKAYEVIRILNKEMRDKGYLVIQGRVNKNYFLKKVTYEEQR